MRFEWGFQGVRLVGSLADVVIIIDALCFSTCVDIAVSRGAAVLPYQWKDQRAREYAGEMGAELATPREEGGVFSLSPASMLNAAEGSRIILPSPNGSELSVTAEALGRIVLTGCFRNCRAVAKYAASRGDKIAVIACGERWPDGSTRPAVEDVAAAGAVIAQLPGTCSPEASVAKAAWNCAKEDLGKFLESCASGRELTERGYQQDVRLAAELNASAAVPMLQEHAYRRVDLQRGLIK